MSTVAIFILPNPGGLLATLDLANRLSGQKHTVHYFGLANSAKSVRDRGFPFTPVFEAHFPEGFLHETETLETLSPGLTALRAQRTFVSRIKAFIDDLLSRGGEELRDKLLQLSPDLVIFASADQWMEWPAFVAQAAGLACIYFHDSLTPGAKSGLPPISSPLIPTGSWPSRWQISIAWWRLQFERRLRSMILSPLGLYLDFDGIRRRLAANYGYPLEQCSTDRQVPRLTELIAWPQALEFACPKAPDQIYIGTSLSLHRPVEPFPWDRLDENRPLFYCALGSLLWFAKDRYRRFFQTVIDVAQSGPNRQWVLATGGGLNPKELEPLSSNIVIVRHAPQLDLLRRARLMITHGGANTIKECAFFGVPMIAFPLGYDHPGNSARMVHHGLGLRGDIRKLTVPYLEDLISKVEGSTIVRERASQIQTVLREEQDAAALMQIMGALLGDKNIARDCKNCDVLSHS